MYIEFIMRTANPIFSVIEKAVLILLICAVYFAILYHPAEPVFMGEFNNLDGSLYAAGFVDVLAAVIIFMILAFRLVPRFLPGHQWLRFIIAALVLVSLASLAAYGLDRLLPWFLRLRA